ncbi:MAG: hypothetical protein IIC60_11315 [Proteobacteria bacterium]|nr:hypothetical protein [Pseudomonadota bacterium]
MSRKIRRNANIAFTGLGVGIIITALLLGSWLGLGLQLPLALFGVLIMEGGLWGFSGKMLPSERRFTALRNEADNILRLVRQLNAAGIAATKGTEDDERFQATLEEMHNSVRLMARLATQEDNL